MGEEGHPQVVLLVRWEWGHPTGSTIGQVGIVWGGGAHPGSIIGQVGGGATPR